MNVVLASENPALIERVRRVLSREVVLAVSGRELAAITPSGAVAVIDGALLGRAGLAAFVRRVGPGRALALVRPSDATMQTLYVAGLSEWCDVVASDDELRQRVARLRRTADSRRPRKSDVLIGGAWTTALFDRLATVAATDSPIAIRGESGTGKELVARTVHAHSRRSHGPFVAINCAAIPAALLEDELFGHVRGAFTDASRDRDGMFASADGGTLFLDEIGEMPERLQASLLRVIQTNEFRRLGDDKDTRVDVRIITATHRNLEDEVAAGRFRADLYYRIHVFPLTLPALRERKADIPLLAQHFILRLAPRLGKVLRGIAPDALDKLASHNFPGNVRELENILHHAAVVAQGEVLTARDIVVPSETDAGPVDLAVPFRLQKLAAIAAFERAYLVSALRAAVGNVAEVARVSGMDRKNIWQLIKKHRLAADAFRK